MMWTGETMLMVRYKRLLKFNKYIESGQLSRFFSEENGLNGCFGAQFEGTPKGGSVTWKGSGLFAARLVGNH